LFVLVVISYTIVMTWLFNNTRGSIFLAILTHSAIDSTTVFYLLLFPQAAQAVASPAQSGAATNLSVLLSLAITWAVIAVLVGGLTKGRLSYKLAVSHEAQTPVEQNQQTEQG
jgi:uncharacterized protein